MNGLFDPRREHDACGVGFVAYLDGQSRHDVMHMALGAMTRMAHRGGGDGKNGDGAGILFPLPRDFFLRQWPALSVCAAPWAVAQLFLPQDTALRALCLQRFREIFTACGLRVEDERDVPVREDVLAPAARQTMPGFLQLLVLPDIARIPKMQAALMTLSPGRAARCLPPAARLKAKAAHRCSAWAWQTYGKRVGDCAPPCWRYPAQSGPRFLDVYRPRMSTSAMNCCASIHPAVQRPICA